MYAVHIIARPVASHFIISTARSQSHVKWPFEVVDFQVYIMWDSLSIHVCEYAWDSTRLQVITDTRSLRKIT